MQVETMTLRAESKARAIEGSGIADGVPPPAARSPAGFADLLASLSGPETRAASTRARLEEPAKEKARSRAGAPERAARERAPRPDAKETSATRSRGRRDTEADLVRADEEIIPDGEEMAPADDDTIRQGEEALATGEVRETASEPEKPVEAEEESEAPEAGGAERAFAASASGTESSEASWILPADGMQVEPLPDAPDEAIEGEGEVQGEDSASAAPEGEASAASVVDATAGAGSAAESVAASSAGFVSESGADPEAVPDGGADSAAIPTIEEFQPANDGGGTADASYGSEADGGTDPGLGSVPDAEIEAVPDGETAPAGGAESAGEAEAESQRISADAGVRVQAVAGRAAGGAEAPAPRGPESLAAGDGTSAAAVEGQAADRGEATPARAPESIAVRGGIDPSDRAGRDALIRVIQSRIEAGGGRIGIRLQPPSLGNVDVDIAVRDGRARIEFRVESPTARQMLASGLRTLESSLAESGVEVVEMHVSIGDREGDGHATGWGAGGSEEAERDAGEVTPADAPVETLAAAPGSVGGRLDFRA
ncbi:MAG: flagellar hook-length control protein FliK [Planctomycetes bacterium]|nr:flagellar hook-length control protein FliK [Planctomycetota bacterium]